jgi:hypothetical protein
MLSAFLQAAKDEQRRRNALRWNFVTIADNGIIPSENA